MNSLRNVLGSGKKYIVPKFQRDYSWEDGDWRDLWEDLEFLNKKENEHHYFGYLVLQKTDDTTFKVIDGQQRLTTFSLIVLAAIQRLKEINGEVERIDALSNSFLGSKDLVYLQVENKITLNRNNDHYYREAVAGNPIPKQNIKKTVRLMNRAIGYFHEQFADFDKGETIGKFIEHAAHRLLFTTIYIGDDLNAYTVFETLNARGVKLSSADLLKNYLFSIMDKNNNAPDEVVDKWDQKWEIIGGHLGKKDYADYVLNEWNSSHKLVRKTMLFKDIKKEINSAEKAHQYLDRLQQNSPLYVALLNENDEFWKDHPKSEAVRRSIALLILFNIPSTNKFVDGSLY